MMRVAPSMTIMFCAAIIDTQGPSAYERQQYQRLIIVFGRKKQKKNSKYSRRKSTRCLEKHKTRITIASIQLHSMTHILMV